MWGKLIPTGLGGVLWYCERDGLFMNSRQVGVRDSNEVEVLAILEVLHIYYRALTEDLILVSDSFNAGS